MKTPPDPSRPHTSWSLRQFLLRRSFQILGCFTVFFLATVIPFRRAPSLATQLPVCLAFVLGAAIWVATFVCCVHAFFIPAERPSFIASFTFFLFLGIELLMLFPMAFS